MKKNFLFFALITLVLSFSVNISAQQERFAKPFDEAGKDASFKRFRDSLLRTTVKNKNKRQLYAAIDKNIQIGFGVDQGINDFKKNWKLNTSKSKVWEELSLVLENGGKFVSEGQDKTFCAPYLFTAMPTDLDEFEHQAIFGTNVNLREKPNLNSNVLTKLSHNIVKVDYTNSVTSTTDKYEYIWAKVKTLGGKEGYVGAKFVRSSIDYRACFRKVRGRWKMTAFLAGD